MNVRVAYYSATGNTRKVADAIAKAAGCAAASIAGKDDQAGDDATPVDLLFLGAAVYATHDHGLHEAVKAFIAGLDPAKVKRVALFSTGFTHSEAAAMLRRLLASRGIPVEADAFFCLGRFALFNLGHPNAADLEAAAAFAEKIVARIPRR
jgi:flavodoxin